MNKGTTLLRKKLLFLLIPSLIGIAYLGSTVLSSSPRKNQNTVKLNNLTRSCDLLNIERQKGDVKVSVQNNSNKLITAYVLTSMLNPNGAVFTFREEFAFSEDVEGIPPGQSYDKIISLPDSLNRQKEITLNFSSVIYEDGSSEGDPKTIRDALDHRLGRKVQMMKALPVLERAANLSDTDIGFYWNKSARQNLEDALNKPDRDSLLQFNKKIVNSDEPYKESEQFKMGTQTGEETILRKYEELKGLQEKYGVTALRDRIIEWRALYTKIVNKP